MLANRNGGVVGTDVDTSSAFCPLACSCLSLMSPDLSPLLVRDQLTLRLFLRFLVRPFVSLLLLLERLGCRLCRFLRLLRFSLCRRFELYLQRCLRM